MSILLGVALSEVVDGRPERETRAAVRRADARAGQRSLARESGDRISRELDGSSPSKRQASERDDQERDEKGCDHEGVLVVSGRRETVEWPAVCAERLAGTYEDENGKERPTAPRTGRTNADLETRKASRVTG